MAGKTFVVICALLFVQLASARVVRDAPATPESPFSDLISQFGNAVKDIQGKALEIIGVKNTEELNTLVVNEVKTFAGKLDESSKLLKQTIDENKEKLENSEAIKNLRTRLDESIQELKKENPTTANNIEKLTETAKSLVEDLKKIGDSDSAKQLKVIGDQILEASNTALKDVAEQIKKTTTAQN